MTALENQKSKAGPLLRWAAEVFAFLGLGLLCAIHAPLGERFFALGLAFLVIFWRAALAMTTAAEAVNKWAALSMSAMSSGRN